MSTRKRGRRALGAYERLCHDRMLELARDSRLNAQQISERTGVRLDCCQSAIRRMDRKGMRS